MIMDDPTMRTTQRGAVIRYPPFILRPEENVQRR
jgi:hypothetical protein